MLQLKILHALTKTWCSQINKQKRGYCSQFLASPVLDGPPVSVKGPFLKFAVTYKCFSYFDSFLLQITENSHNKEKIATLLKILILTFFM